MWEEEEMKRISSGTVSVLPIMVCVAMMGLFAAVPPVHAAGGDSGYSMLSILAIYTVGLLLLMVEVFVLPGFGIAGIAGGGAILYALYVISFKMYGDPVKGIAISVGLLILAGILIYMGLKLLLKTEAGKEMVLDASIDAKVSSAEQRFGDEWVGRIMTTLTECKPAGTAEYETSKYDVYSYSGLIKPGVKVEVLKVEGNKLVVKPVEEEK